ncbi:MAG: LysR family transcriptional regulator [Acidobacteriaceae bacterium]|nr:LysR family transcriptional regulator [Acidobacteriaceae bacterium]
MEIHQLRYFCAVARTRSFTKAAEQERVAQPSLSQQISRLEQSLGAKLFDRLGRGVQLTEAGRALLPQATEILRQLNNAKTAVESLRRGVAGRLAVGCIPTVTPYFLAPQIGDFAQKFPDVDLRLVEEITPKLVELLQAGELDLAVVSPPLHNPDLVCSDLFRETIYVAVCKKHRLASARQVSLPALNDERLLLLKEGHCFRDNALTICSRSQTNFVSIFETNQFSSILPLVGAGFGVSLVPHMAVTADAPCVFLPLEREAHRRIGYVRVRRHAAGTAQKAFIQWLRETSRAWRSTP